MKYYKSGGSDPHPPLPLTIKDTLYGREYTAQYVPDFELLSTSSIFHKRKCRSVCALVFEAFGSQRGSVDEALLVEAFKRREPLTCWSRQPSKELDWALLVIEVEQTSNYWNVLNIQFEIHAREP
jgi:hypothetical protein